MDEISLSGGIMCSYLLFHDHPHILDDVEIGAAPWPWLQEIDMFRFEPGLYHNYAMTRSTILLEMGNVLYIHENW